MTQAIAKVDKFLGSIEIEDIHNDAEYQDAVTLLKKIKKAAKLLEADRKERTKDLLAQKRSIDAEYKPGAKRAKEIEADLKEAIQSFKARKEQERIALTEGPMTREKVDALAETHVPEAEGLSVRRLKKLVVDDESAVPREYLELNTKRILDALKAGESVPGCRLVEEEVLAVRS